MSSPAPHSPYPNYNREERLKHRRRIVRSYRSKADARRTFSQRFADFLRTKFGSVAFLGVNVLFLAAWVSINSGWVPGMASFDPYPFGLLVLCICLEAIVLDIVVLISQDRSARIAEIREEASLHIGAITEEEVTKIIQILTLLLKERGVTPDDDEELREMLQPLKPEQIEESLENQLK
jgi:uncharacterized membrane protein